MRIDDWRRRGDRDALADCADLQRDAQIDRLTRVDDDAIVNRRRETLEPCRQRVRSRRKIEKPVEAFFGRDEGLREIDTLDAHSGPGDGKPLRVEDLASDRATGRLRGAADNGEQRQRESKHGVAERHQRILYDSSDTLVYESIGRL